MPTRPKIHRPKRQTPTPQSRGTTAERGYGSAWQRLSKHVLACEPLCRHCAERGLVVPATCVDHIDGDSRHNEIENLQPLCVACHSVKSIEQDGTLGLKPKVKRD